MADANVLKPFILSWEGGFCDVYGDRGGATNKGITLTTFRGVFGLQKTIEDLKKITDEQWTKVFVKYYWNKWKADSIKSQSIANLLVDWFWHSGIYGIKLPQKILGVTIDGVVGPKTIAAINNYGNDEELFNKLWNERKEFLERLAKGPQKKFLKGWLNRLNGIKYKKLFCNGHIGIDCRS